MTFLTNYQSVLFTRLPILYSSSKIFFSDSNPPTSEKKRYYSRPSVRTPEPLNPILEKYAEESFPPNFFSPSIVAHLGDAEKDSLWNEWVERSTGKKKIYPVSSYPRFYLISRNRAADILGDVSISRFRPRNINDESKFTNPDSTNRIRKSPNTQGNVDEMEFPFHEFSEQKIQDPR